MARVIVVVVGLTLAGGAALADGGFFPVYEGVANTANQRAVVVDHGGAETIVLQTAYNGDASDFAWVIPVPSVDALEIDTVDPGIFDDLDRITAPRAVTWERSSFVCGCAGAEGDGHPGGEQRAGVTVWRTLRVDDYEVAVLSADESVDLTAWLQANGYGFPEGHEDTLQYYVARESFFVAFKIAPHDTNGDPAPPGTPGDGVPVPHDLRPITLTFATDEIVFPIRISRVSTVERAEVLLYVISRQRVRSSNYRTREVYTERSWSGDNFSQTYDRWLQRTIDELNKERGRGIVVEYAGELPSWELNQLQAVLPAEGPFFVTRMRTRLDPAQMEEDIMLVADGGRHFEVEVSDGVAEVRATVAGGFMLFAGLQALVFRSHRGRRSAWATAMFALVVAIL